MSVTYENNHRVVQVSAMSGLWRQMADSCIGGAESITGQEVCFCLFTSVEQHDSIYFLDLTERL